VGLKATHKAAVQELDRLFASLQHRAIALRHRVTRMAGTSRISRLAYTSGRNPAELRRFTQRDGFEAVKLSISENAQADAEFAACTTIAHADVMRDALNTFCKWNQFNT
jgi:hypothetical protein